VNAVCAPCSPLHIQVPAAPVSPASAAAPCLVFGAAAECGLANSPAAHPGSRLVTLARDHQFDSQHRRRKIPFGGFRSRLPPFHRERGLAGELFAGSPLVSQAPIAYMDSVNTDRTVTVSHEAQTCNSQQRTNKQVCLVNGLSKVQTTASRDSGDFLYRITQNYWIAWA
jgi:hypothetical protein